MPAIFMVTAAVIWLACGAVIVTAAVRSGRHPSALHMGRLGVGVLYVGGGAAVNALFLLLGEDYADFAEGSYIPLRPSHLAIAFHVALLSFGVGFFVWCPPMIGALATLLRSEHCAESQGMPEARTPVDAAQAAWAMAAAPTVPRSTVPARTLGARRPARRSVRFLVGRHPIGAYFALAFGLSWGYWLPDAMAGGHWSHFPGCLCADAGLSAAEWCTRCRL